MDSSPAKVVVNVPNAMATQIPLSRLVFSEETVDIGVINAKEWTGNQVSMWLYTQNRVNWRQVFDVRCQFIQTEVTDIPLQSDVSYFQD